MGLLQIIWFICLFCYLDNRLYLNSSPMWNTWSLWGPAVHIWGTCHPAPQFDNWLIQGDRHQSCHNWGAVVYLVFRHIFDQHTWGKMSNHWWFGTWILFSISHIYIYVCVCVGCHPKPIDLITHIFQDGHIAPASRKREHLNPALGNPGSWWSA